MADAPDSNPGDFGRVGSTPTSGTMNMNDYPIITLTATPKQNSWNDGWNIGTILEHFFPNEDPINFAQACAYNDWGPVLKDGSLQIEGLLMLEEGEHDGDECVWLVRASGHHFIATGGCDYTGWDCQSHLRWSVLPPTTWSEVVTPRFLASMLSLDRLDGSNDR